MKYPKVNYIGNKEKIASWICEHIPEDVDTIFDAFSGGCSFAYEAKKRGYQLITNDILQVNYELAKALIENNKITLSKEDVSDILLGTPLKGFMYDNYSNVFFFPRECMELDLYRENIEQKVDCEYKRAMAFSLIRRSMIRKMPYSRFNIKWEKVIQLRDEEYSYQKYKRKRAYHNESFAHHFNDNLDEYNNAVFDNGCRHIAYNKDVFDILGKVKADLVYLDPPYAGTLNNYYGFYGLVDHYIKSKRTRPFDNNFRDKGCVLNLFEKLCLQLSEYKYWMLSYNNGAYPNQNQLLEIINRHSRNVNIVEKSHVYKLRGASRKGGSKEFLFIVEN